MATTSLKARLTAAQELAESRSAAARKGVLTRRYNQLKAKQAAASRKGWETRRANGTF